MQNITNWTKDQAIANQAKRVLDFEAAKAKYSDKAIQYKKAANRLKSANSFVEIMVGYSDIISRIKAEVEAGALFICNHSGGKDSQAMYILLYLLVPKDQLIVVHADLGRVEWAGIKDHIKSTTSHELHVVKAVDKNGQLKDLLQSVYERAASLAAKGKKAAPWFSPSQRYCTSSFKTGPIEKFVRAYMKANGFTRAVNCMGIRGQESTERSENIPLELNKNLSKAGRTVFNWLPIFDMQLEGANGIWDVIAQAGQVRHTIYDKGMSRLSCCFCVMAKKRDIKIAATLNPELFAQYVKAEKDLGYTMFAKQDLESFAGITVGEAFGQNNAA